MDKNPEQGIINTRQLIWLLFIVIVAFTVLELPGLILTVAGRDAWLAVLGGWFLDILMAAVIASLARRFPGENFVQYAPKILGKIPGRVIGLLFIGFFLVSGSMIMHGLGVYLGEVFLPKTPPGVIQFAAYLLIVYMVRRGLEVIARTCEILGPVLLISLLGLVFMAGPLAHLERLKPQFDLGLRPFLTGVPLVFSYLGICIAMSWYIPFCNRPQNGFAAKFIALGLGTVFIILFAVLGIAIFGVEHATRMDNPVLEIARLVHVADYFERMEIIWLTLAIGAEILMTAGAVWIVCLSAAQMAGLATYHPLVWPVTLLFFALSTDSFPSHLDYLNFANYAFPIFALLIEPLALILLIAALITGKKTTR